MSKHAIIVVIRNSIVRQQYWHVLTFLVSFFVSFTTFRISRKFHQNFRYFCTIIIIRNLVKILIFPCLLLIGQRNENLIKKKNIKYQMLSLLYTKTGLKFSRASNVNINLSILTIPRGLFLLIVN